MPSVVREAYIPPSVPAKPADYQYCYWRRRRRRVLPLRLLLRRTTTTTTTTTLCREFRAIILRNRLGNLGQAGVSKIAKQPWQSCPCPTCSPTSVPLETKIAGLLCNLALPICHTCLPTSLPYLPVGDQDGVAILLR